MKLYEDKNWLYQKYWIEKLNIREMGKMCNVNCMTILYWMKKFKVKRRPKHLNGSFESKEDEQWIRRFLKETYIREGMSTYTLGEIIGVSSTTIRRWLNKFNIKLRSAPEAKKGLSLKKLIGNKYAVGYSCPEELKRKLSKLKKGKTVEELYGFKIGQKVRKRISETHKGKKLSEEHKRILRESLNKRPTNPEKIFDKLTSREVMYVGNGDWWRRLPNGKYKNPDFKIKDQKKVIEIFGDYWHKGENPQKLISLYAQIGLNCLVIWEHEIYNQPKIVLNKTNNFINI